MRRGFAFEFEEPLGWEDFSDGSRVVFHGPSGEELVVSGSFVTGSRDAHDSSAVRQQIVSNALQAMKYAVDLPDVVVSNGIIEKSTAGGCRRWDLVANTADGQTEFFQAAIEGPGGVLLVTLEAPSSDGRSDFFEEFVSGVRPVATGG